MLNLSMLLENHARNRPARELVVFGAMRLTYGQVDAMACQVANALVARGIRPGDRVALSCPNLPYFPIVYYGILKAGGIVVPLNVLFKGDEIAYHLQDSGARAYFFFEGTPELPMGLWGDEGVRRVPGCETVVVLTATPGGPSPVKSRESFGAFLQGMAPSFDSVARQPDDTAVILYTSGTTGRPKGAELTHANMVLNAMVSRDLAIPEIGNAPAVAVVALPLFHSFAQTVQMNAQALHGGTIVLVPRFEPGAVLEAMVKEKANLYAGVPTMYWGLLNHVKKTGFDTAAVAASLKLCTSGGAAMPVELLRAFEEAFGVKILEGYGLSETSPVATFNQADLPRKVGSIGVPVFGCEVRVVDDAMNDTPVNEPGEVVIRGHNVMKGYWEKPEATAEAFRGGWFHTGDVARRDEDGYFFIMDRIKDMILRGGFNVYPREIEELLLTHPAVSMAAVVGIPDEKLGEEIKAYIVRRPGATDSEENIIEWCKERLAAYKYPRHVEFRDTLPMTATGKILKRELKAAPAHV